MNFEKEAELALMRVRLALEVLRPISLLGVEIRYMKEKSRWPTSV